MRMPKAKVVRAFWRNACKSPIWDQLARYEDLRGYAKAQAPMQHHRHE
jgi:hypothetical protein